MRPTAYKHYVLGVLTTVLLFNYVDRLALGLMLEDIKHELLLTDTELGFLNGIAFALFYSVMGLPIARWADRGNRVTIIAVTALLWSVAVALCGTAGSFRHLLLIRVAVAVGEAGCIAPAFSLMADYFTRSERPRATAIYGLGGPLAAIVGYFFAGWLNEFFGWRTTFVFLGAPGVLLAAVAWITLREPRRAMAKPGRSPVAVSTFATDPTPDLKTVWKTLWGNATFRHLLWSLSANFFFQYGIWQWQPTLFVRSFGLTTGQIGTGLTVTFGLGGLIGTYLVGQLAYRYAPNNERLQLRGMAIAMAVSAIPSLALYFTSSAYIAFGLVTLITLVQAASNGPLFSTIQTLVPERMRAVAFALVYLFANLIGMGLGPLAAGMLSDAFRPWAGEESLRYALMLLAPGYILCGVHAWLASKSVTRDLAAAQRRQMEAISGERPVAVERQLVKRTANG